MDDGLVELSRTLVCEAGTCVQGTYLDGEDVERRNAGRTVGVRHDDVKVR